MTKIIKSPKVTKKIVVDNKIHYDIFSKSRGYITSAMDEVTARETLESLHWENQKFWRKAQSEGKRWKRCDCYCICRNGLKEWELPFFIEEQSEEDEQYLPEGNIDA